MEGGRVLLVMGVIMLMVRMIILMVSFCFLIQGKKVFNGVMWIIISIRIEMVIVVLWLINFRVVSLSRISRVILNIMVFLLKSKFDYFMFKWESV